MRPGRLAALLRAIAATILLVHLLSCSSGSGGGGVELGTPEDDVRVGQEGAETVASELGLLGDEDLDAYVDSVGRRVLKGLGKPRFEYSFRVVNEAQPNAFVLPGGFVFLTRGLLVLMNDEDELACVLGHEIIHVEQRHAARHRELEEEASPMLGTWRRAVRLASYSREMEREADRLGQGLCAAAGHDPNGMASLMRSLRQVERVRFGFSRQPSFLDTHPGLPERAAINSSRATKIRWNRDPRIGDPREALLRRTAGLDVGQRAASGLFVNNRFLHPVLDFQITFPRGWTFSANHRAIGAISPETDAIVYLTTDQPAGDPRTRAEEWLASLEDMDSLRVERSRAVTVGRRPAWRLDLSHGGWLRRTEGSVIFVSHGDATYRLIGVAATRAGRRELGRTLTAIRSFRRLAPEARARIQAHRMRVVTAEPAETIAQLGSRVGDTWVPTRRAIMNGLFSNHAFAGGELVKVALAEPYDPEQAEAAARNEP